jgi:signal transduction histidine kinase
MRAIDFAWCSAASRLGVVAWVADPWTWQLTQVSTPDDALLGFSRGAWTEPGFWISRVEPTDRSAVRTFFEAISRGAEVPPCEYRWLDARDESHWIRTSASLTQDDTGQWLVALHRDTTAERASLDRASAAERRSDGIARLGGIGVWEYDSDRGTVRVDPALLRLLGLDPTRSPSHEEWMARVHPHDRDRVTTQLDEAFAVQSPTLTDSATAPGIEFRVRGCDGSWRWLTRTMTLVDRDGAPPQLAAVIADTTEMIRERRARQHAERLYREIWDSIPGSAVALDARGTIVDANPAWRDTAIARGAPGNAFVGESYLEVARRAAVAGDITAARALDGLCRVLSRKSERFSMEYESRAPDHTDPRWYRLSAFALKRPTRGAIVLHWDITDRRISDLSIQQARDHLADIQRLSTMSELATSIAHELNQPLATIMASASTARRQLGDNGEAPLRPIIDDIMEATARAAEVMRRARSMIRRDRRQVEPLELKDIVAAVSRLLASDLIIHQVELTVRVSEAPPVQGDRVQLQQVLINLLLNAVEAVRNEPRPRRRVNVTVTHPAPDRVDLVVSDTGCGIPAEMAGRVFEPFTTTKSQGTGLGLTIVRAIVEAHGGRVSVESPSEGGAAFRVSLPC